MNNLALVESRTLREENISRTEVLKKVKAIDYITKDKIVSVEQSADYYEVGIESVKSIIKRNHDELTTDGLKILKGNELKIFKGKVQSGPSLKYASHFTIIPRRALLRIGMLLTESEVAAQVRTMLLNKEELAREDNTPKITGKQFALESTKLLIPLMNELKLNPESKMAAIKSLYDEAGIKLPFHIQLPDNLLTCTDMAKKLGVYSKSGKPHYQAIGAIIDMLNIQPNEVCVTLESNEATQYSRNKYYPSVLEKVKGWLIIKGKPSQITTPGRNYNIKYLR